MPAKYHPDWPPCRDMSPAEFAVRASGGRWTRAPHLDLLDTLLWDLAGRHIRRLVVAMPPRHGKSEFISKYFPAWYLCLFPEHRVILTSYEAEFAATWGRKVQDLIALHGDAVAHVAVDPATTAAARWNLAGSPGGMDTAGAGGPIVGKGADLFICDDPIKNAEEASSETRREAIWDWFCSTAYTRLEPDGVFVLVMTRWHEDDLAGRILRDAARGDPWIYVRVPALSDGPEVYAEITRFGSVA
jgi:hypothetical protein